MSISSINFYQISSLTRFYAPHRAKGCVSRVGNVLRMGIHRNMIISGGCICAYKYGWSTLGSRHTPDTIKKTSQIWAEGFVTDPR